MGAGEPRGEGAATRRKAAAASTLGDPTRELADRLAEEAARAAEYRAGRVHAARGAGRREDAERVRDNLMRRLASREDTPGSLRPADDVSPDRDEGPWEGTEAPRVGEEEDRRGWFRRFFGF